MRSDETLAYAKAHIEKLQAEIENLHEAVKDVLTRLETIEETVTNKQATKFDKGVDNILGFDPFEVR